MEMMRELLRKQKGRGVPGRTFPASSRRLHMTAREFAGLRAAIENLWAGEGKERVAAKAREKTPWEKTARRRRLVLLFLLAVPTLVAGGLMAKTLPQGGVTALKLALVALFTGLYTWLLFGFWTGVAGFYSLIVRRGRAFAVDTAEISTGISIPGGVRTAIVIPVRNEKVDRIFAGVQSARQSLRLTGHAGSFDFFILSDTDDPDKWVEEEAAWDDLREREENPGGRGPRVFYRNRRVNIKRKSGNIADFCRRWGNDYRYMIVLDADSAMTGIAMVRMVAAMEKNPAVGILQTSPRAVNAKTLFARIQQFAGHLYGPMFSAGLHFWQLGDSQYWGHNAIIRVEPFVKYCSLPVLSGAPPMGGYILSHDFVEAALMRRAGWEVWLANGIEGSYEELPPTLPDDLGRDRRWCQGNLQHLRLLFTEGLSSAHRTLFVAGAMAYISGLLWFLFLAAGTMLVFTGAFATHSYFTAAHQLFPLWPVWRLEQAMVLLTSTAFLLFFPKLLSVTAVWLRGRSRSFGGIPKLFASAAAETVFSAMVAPVRMLSHSKFVLLTMLGRKVKWDPQKRGERTISWSGALRFHWAGTAFGLVWGTSAFLIDRTFFWWITPVLFPLIMSGPLSAWSSRPSAGRMFKRMGLFLTEEEISPGRELVWLESYMESYRSNGAPLPIDKRKGFARAVLDPRVNALHRSLLRSERHYCRSIMQKRRQLRQKAHVTGPDRLTASEKKELLLDPLSMAVLHEAVWNDPDGDRLIAWGIELPPYAGRGAVAM